jgi:uncharacterized 2Fe-2S/4Fe-4S cluster protein (DUF4445 family)
MPRITFHSLGITVEVPPGLDLRDAAKQAGIELDFPCGGQGTCGRCAARLISGRLDVIETSASADTVLDEGYILACRAKIGDEDAVLEVRKQPDLSAGQFIDEEEEASFMPPEWQERPADQGALVSAYFLEVTAQQEGEGGSDLERLNTSLWQNPEEPAFDYSLPALRELAGALRGRDGKAMAAAGRFGERRRLIHLEAGGDIHSLYGIAVDLGTTTVAVNLVSLTENRIVASRTDYNGQVVCGLDIISRINYAGRPERLEELRLRALKTINGLIGRLVSAIAPARNRIYGCALSGNTTMIHLLLGLNPEYIRLSPYTPTILDMPPLRAGDIGLDIHPEGPVFISPAVGSYVGGDIAAGLLCTGSALSNDEICLFVDIGTNGEIVVGNGDFLMACACSAGPAFEGGGIGSGMRAAHGAIDRVQIDRKTGQAIYRTIGDIPPRGICGSGMLSLLAGLFLGEWLDASGRFKRPSSSPFIDFKGRLGIYTVVHWEKNAITVTERDIENLIRAKAALYAACGLLLKRAGIGFQDIAKIFIAGGFGRYLDIEDAVTVGLLPDIPRDRLHYLGNASLKGSTMILLSEEYRQLQQDLVKRMTYVELNADPEYMDQYTGALFLPHTDRSQFPSLKNRLAD